MRQVTSGLSTALLASALFFGEGVSAADTTIDASNLYFCSPSFQGAVCETTIDAGDTVTWQMVLGSHTVTECNDAFTVCPPAGGFDSGFLSGGATFAHQFNSTDNFEYWCALHPSLMRGRIIVQQLAPTPTPTPAPTATSAPPSGTVTPSATATPAPLPAAAPSTGEPSETDSVPLAIAALAAGTAMIWAGLTLLSLSRRRV